MPDQVVFIDCSNMTPDGGPVIGSNVPGTPGALLIKNLVPQPGGGRFAVPKLPNTVELTTSNGDDHYIGQAMKLAPHLVYTAGADYAAAWDLSAGTYTRIAGPFAPYTAGSNPAWQIEEFGNNVILLPNDTSAGLEPQIRVAHSGSCADLFTSTAEPLARCMAVVRAHLFLGDCLYSGTRYSQRVWWSARDDPRDFDPAVSTRCGFVDLTDKYGPVRAIAGGTNAIVFKDDAIHRMDFVGGETVWEQQLIATGVGCVSPHAMVELAGNIYFRSRDGFYVLENRSTVQPIGKEEVWQTPLRLANTSAYGPWSDEDGDPGITGWYGGSKWQAFAFRGNGLVAFRYTYAADGPVVLVYAPHDQRWSMVKPAVNDPKWYFDWTRRKGVTPEVSASADHVASPAPGLDIMAVRIVSGETQLIQCSSGDGGDVGTATIGVWSKCIELPGPARLVGIRPKYSLGYPLVDGDDLFPAGSISARPVDVPAGYVDPDPDGADAWADSTHVDADGWHSIDPLSAAYIQVRWEIDGDSVTSSGLSKLCAFYGFELKISTLEEGPGRDGRGT